MSQMSEVDAAPPAETDSGEDNSTLEAVIGRRHEPQQEHEAHREVGDEPDEGAALAALAAKAPTAAAPKPETPPAAAPAAPAATAAPDPVDDPKSPRWFRDEMKKLRAENQRLATTQGRQDPAPPRPAAPPAELPNPAEDPQGYHDAVQRGLVNQMQRFQLETKLNLSERFAVQQHGGEAFEECKAWLSTKPDIEAWAIQQPDPWAAAFTQYNRERLAEEIGDDPNAWREKERQRLRDEIRAEMEGEATPVAPARPAPQMRSAPPAPASAARSTMERDARGQFTGPAPLKTRNTFT